VIVQLLLLVFLLLIASVGPGMLLTRRMRLAPLERLCTALGLSWIVVYLFSTAIYLSGISWHWAYVGSLIALAMFLKTWPDTKRLLANHAVRQTVCGFFLLLIWTLLLLSLIRNYSGGRWFGDWFEHFDRANFFLHRGNVSTLFLNLYLLPARPPMMNLVAAFFLAQVGKGFPAFELCFAILNLCALFPAALLLNQLAPRGARGVWFLVMALLSSPFFAENVTFTWTKLFCAFYVLLAISLYLRRRPILAFTLLAAACLIHYSAGPFVLYFAGHYLWNFFRRKGNWRELLAIVAISAAFLFSWFGWSIQRYGLHTTLSANTAVTDAAKFSAAENLAKVAKNISDSIVPPITGRLDPRWQDQSTLAFVRDAAFFCYQQNILFMLGSVGAFVALWILWRTATKHLPTRLNDQRIFWFGMIIFCIPVAIATVGEYEPLGLAHAVLQPLALIGIVAVAAYARWLPRWARQLLLLGWALDFLLGILLQVYLENMTFQQTIVAGKQIWSMPVKMVIIAAQNFRIKAMMHLKFIGDYCASGAPALMLILMAVEVAGLCWLFSSGNRKHYDSASGNRRAVARKLS
jgi:hypothetical protein